MAAERAGERRGPRPLYRATVGFGLVQIPVALHRAIAKKTVRFRELHDADGGHIQHRPVCARDGAQVTREHIVKGYALPDGRHVQVLPSEIEALAPVASRRIEIDAFVDPAEIDPTLLDGGFLLAPADGAGRAYALLRDAMAALHRVGVGRTILHARERVCVVRPVGSPRRPGSALALDVLVYADELLPASELPGLPAGLETSERERILAERLVERQAARFEPERYHDEHRARILAYLHQKAEGAAVAPPPAPPPPPADVELIPALEASLAEADRRPRAA